MDKHSKKWDLLPLSPHLSPEERADRLPRRRAKLYKIIRRQDPTLAAQYAWARAGILVAWEELEMLGLVRLDIEPETEPHDPSYVDTWEISPRSKQRMKAQIQKQIEDEGLWMASFAVRATTKDEFKSPGLTVGDIVGDCEEVYDDLRMEAVSAWYEARDAWAAEQARELAERATFAGPAAAV